jgi:hypothetical protein
VRGDVPVDSDTLLVTDFVNLKIKSAQFFRDAHRDKMCVRVFIGVSAHTYVYEYLHLYCISKKIAKCTFGPSISKANRSWASCA